MVAFSREALEQCGYMDLLERIGFSNPWVLWDNYFNEMTNYATKRSSQKNPATVKRGRNASLARM
jgi:hypothetical protein